MLISHLQGAKSSEAVLPPNKTCQKCKALKTREGFHYDGRRYDKLQGPL